MIGTTKLHIGDTMNYNNSNVIITNFCIRGCLETFALDVVNIDYVDNKNKGYKTVFGNPLDKYDFVRKHCNRPARCMLIEKSNPTFERR